MRRALARHRADLEAANGVLSHRLVCPAARLGELASELRESDRVRLALIVAPFEAEAIEEALGLLSRDERLELAALEGPLPEGGGVPADAVPAGVPAFAEIPVTGEWRPAFDRLAAARGSADLPSGAAVGVKARCGGVRPELFPTAEQLASLVHACAGAGLPFKATAGLHHAVRYTDELTGFEHHGYLNLLLASARAVEGAPLASLVEVLCSTDAAALAEEALALPPDLAVACRALFTSYGSCSTSEPVEDLERLGLAGRVDSREDAGAAR